MAPDMTLTTRDLLALARGKVLILNCDMGEATGDRTGVSIWIDGVLQGTREIDRAFVSPEPVALRSYVESGPAPRGTSRNTAQWKKERR